MDLSIIFVNWNSLAYLRSCLASVYRHTAGISFEIIVVDNASPEGGIETLQAEFPGITVIKSDVNLGFAGANNVGFKRSSGRYVLFLNPDTELQGPAINTMMEQIERLPDAGIIGCRLLNTDLSVQLTAIQKFPTIINQLLDIEFFQLRWPGCPLWDVSPLYSDSVKLTKVEVISGACMLLKREVFNQVGMFTEDYFMYAEDIDLNFKVARAGFTNYYVPDAVIVHHGGKSSSQQSVSHWATIMKYRAMKRMFNNTRGRLYGSLYRTSIGCIAVVRLALLGLAYPLGGVLLNKKSIQLAARKWRIILQWAVGSQELAPGSK